MKSIRSLNFIFSTSVICLFNLAGCNSVRHQKNKLKEPQTVTQPVADPSSIQGVIRTLPPEYFSNCPYAHRKLMLEELASANDGRLDVQNGWLNYFSDGGMVSADSIIRLKTFHSMAHGIVVFVHMMKPYNGTIPSPEDTRVLAVSLDQHWQDITDEVLPPQVDRKWHFNPRRSHNMIEAGPWIGNMRWTPKFGPVVTL
jgi:hypothetical protein